MFINNKNAKIYTVQQQLLDKLFWQMLKKSDCFDEKVTTVY